MQKIDLYIDCDGVILDTIKAAKRVAKRLGYDPDDFNSVHEYFLHDVNWKDIIEEAGVIGNVIESINKLAATGLFNVVIFTKLSREVLAKRTEYFYPSHEIEYEESLSGTAPLDYDVTDELYKIQILKNLFPNITVLATDIKHNKNDIVDTRYAILIDDAVRNFRKWRESNEDAVGFLFSLEGRENYIYDYKEDAENHRITDDESGYMIDDVYQILDHPRTKKLIKQMREAA